MTQASTMSTLVPHAAPAAPGARLILFAIRRLGAHGLADARAAETMVSAFGKGFRRPLVLVRAMMADIAASAVTPIHIAPCCCPCMTPAEHTLLTVVARAEREPEAARLLLSDLIGSRRADGALASITAAAVAFDDGGTR